MLTALVRGYLAQEQPERALEQIDKTIQAEPHHAVAWNLKAGILLSQQKVKAAENILREALENNPESPTLYRSLAHLYQIGGDQEQAVITLRRGVSATQSNPALRLALAQLLERSNDRSGAIAEYEGLLESKPQLTIVANNLAMLLAKEGEQQDLDRALALSEHFAESKNPVLRDTLGWVHYQRGEFDEALPILESVVEQAPQVDVFKRHLGLAYQRAGKSVEAQRYLQATVDAEP